MQEQPEQDPTLGQDLVQQPRPKQPGQGQVPKKVPPQVTLEQGQATQQHGQVSPQVPQQHGQVSPQVPQHNGQVSPKVAMQPGQSSPLQSGQVRQPIAHTVTGN